MEEIRRDPKGRKLRTGESYDEKTGRYRYQYPDATEAEFMRLADSYAVYPLSRAPMITAPDTDDDEEPDADLDEVPDDED